MLNVSQDIGVESGIAGGGYGLESLRVEDAENDGMKISEDLLGTSTWPRIMRASTRLAS